MSVQQEEPERELKFSNSIATLKTIQSQKEEPPSRYLRKGTSLYLKDLLQRQRNHARIFTTSPVRSVGISEAIPEVVEDRKKFLPIEAFDPMLDVENPARIIEDYRDESTGLTLAVSKWNYPNGDAELRQCIVQQYIKE